MEEFFADLEEKLKQDIRARIQTSLKYREEIIEQFNEYVNSAIENLTNGLKLIFQLAGMFNTFNLIPEDIREMIRKYYDELVDSSLPGLL